MKRFTGNMELKQFACLVALLGFCCTIHAAPPIPLSLLLPHLPTQLLEDRITTMVATNNENCGSGES